MSNGDRLYKMALKIATSDPEKNKIAQELLERAFNKGNCRAAYALATWYLFGKNVKKDFTKGIELLQFAAKGHIPEAYFDLAVSYENGKGVPKDKNLAFQNYLFASINGDREAIYEIGRCYYYGIGVEENKNLALKLIEMTKSK